MPRKDWTKTQERELARKRELARLKLKTRARVVEARRWRRLEEAAVLRHIRDNQVSTGGLARLLEGCSPEFCHTAERLWARRESDRFHAKTQEWILEQKKQGGVGERPRGGLSVVGDDEPDIKVVKCLNTSKLTC